MVISQMPKAERPRERLLEQGAEALSDAELLALFLRTGLPGVNAISLAHQLLNAFKTLANVIKADYHTFCQHKGLGPAKFVVLQASMEIVKRCLIQHIKLDSPLNSPEVTRGYLQNYFYHAQRELFLVLFLDNQYRVIRSETLFSGTLTRASVHPREVVKAALTHNAAALILAHNHPSGNTAPSKADHQITQRIIQTCELIEVKVLDHFIVGQGSILSFAEQGWL
ncbi:MAG: DNA repair protein RadC [Candidatus Symbiodolus clandestinus]